jgi:hypothetical protein
MRSVVKKLLAILDGTPALYGDRRRGQSIVELALVSPILIILLMGLAEIGWFANNYLILMEVARTGARAGTVQNGDTSPLSWDDNGSLIPDPTGTIVDRRNTVRDCGLVNNPLAKGFYNVLVCNMLKALDPLKLDSTNGVDDIVISTFAIQVIDKTKVPTSPTNYQSMLTTGANGMPATLDSSIPGPQAVVVGRWPANANTCTYNASGNPGLTERDAFNYLQNSPTPIRDYILKNAALGDPSDGSNRLYLELDDPNVFKSGDATTYKSQRGFAWTGQHKIASSKNKCIGSEWDIQRVQQLMNLPSFTLLAPGDVNATKEQRATLASQGMVLVEIFWQHKLLLPNPVFNPVFTAIGTQQTTVSVWAAFPVPAVEPRIRFG